MEIDSFGMFQYVSLLRPPVTESTAPGADIIDKVEWKQVSTYIPHILLSLISQIYWVSK